MTKVLYFSKTENVSKIYNTTTNCKSIKKTKYTKTRDVV